MHFDIQMSLKIKTLHIEYNQKFFFQVIMVIKVIKLLILLLLFLLFTSRVINGDLFLLVLMIPA